MESSDVLMQVVLDCLEMQVVCVALSGYISQDILAYFKAVSCFVFLTSVDVDSA